MISRGTWLTEQESFWLLNCSVRFSHDLPSITQQVVYLLLLYLFVSLLKIWSSFVLEKYLVIVVVLCSASLIRKAL